MDLLLQQTVNAFALGGTYALLALGLAVVFSIMGLINFAHGELMTISGYTLMYCGIAGISFVLAVPTAIAMAMIAAVLMERIAFRPVRNSSGATMLVTSFAISMILQVLFQNFISTRSQPVILPQILSDSVTIGGLVIGVNKIAAIVATIVMLIFLDIFMKRQKTGIAMRAAVAGGFLLGFIEIYLAAFLPPELQEFREPIGLSLVVVVLLFRPNGLIPSASLKAEKV